MKISLLILVHNAEKHIEECVRSLFGQTYGDIEYIFIDDASPDRSIGTVERLLAEFPHRRADVKIITNPHNLGIAESRNIALDNATGDYMLYVDSDDRLAPDAVARLAEKAAATGADIVTFDFYTVYGGTERVREEYFPEQREEYIRALLHRQVRAAMWLKLIRRELFAADGGLRFIPGMDYGEDFYLSPILAYHARRIVKVAEPLYYYRRHASSVSYAITPAKAENVVRAASLLVRFFHGVPDAEIYEPMIAPMLILNKIAILQAGDRATWEYAAGLYEGIGNPKRYGLQTSQRLILWLHKRRMWSVMHLLRSAAGLLKRN